MTPVMHVSEVRGAQAAASAAGLIDGHPHAPLRFAAPGDPDAVSEHWRWQLGTASDAAGAALCFDGETLRGVIVVDRLSWESRTLGREVAGITQLIVTGERQTQHAASRALVDWALTWCRGRATMVHVKRSVDDTVCCMALTRSGFVLTDTQLVYAIPAARAAAARVPLAPGVTVRTARPGDRDAVGRLARRAFSGHFGRFHADPAIAPETATRVYEQWCLDCLDGYADLLLVAEVDGHLAGLTAWRLPQAGGSVLAGRVAGYSIGAIEPAYSGRGLFRLLTATGQQRIGAHAAWIVGPTHARHHSVQRAYASLGWEIVDATHALHFSYA